MNAPRSAPGFALLAALALGAGCMSPRPPAVTTDATLARHAGAAARAFRDGSPEAAGKQYALALDRARALDDASAITVLARNLAACQFELGRLDEARRSAEEARTASERTGLDTASVDVLLARIALALGDLDAAEAALDTAAPRGALRLDAAVTRAEAHLLRKRPDEALAGIEHIAGALRRAAPELQGRADEARAAARQARGETAEAARLMESAAAHWSRAGRSPRVVAALTAAADLQAEAGQLEFARALDLRSARAAAADGHTDQARALLDRARGRGDTPLPAWTEDLLPAPAAP